MSRIPRDVRAFLDEEAKESKLNEEMIDLSDYQDSGDESVVSKYNTIN